MGRLINLLEKEEYISFTSINGGLKVNAIPRESFLKILVEDEYIDDVKKIIYNFNKIIKNELKSSDNNVAIEILKINEKNQYVFSKETQHKINLILMHLPYGINTISSDIDGLVESSSNIGIVSTHNDKIIFSNSYRSSIGSIKNDILLKIQSIAKIVDGKIDLKGEYPEWEYNNKSIIRDKFIKVYKKLYNKTPIITALHAGLECGILSKLLNNVDMISFGPNIIDVHTPNERLSISSTKRSWDYLCAVLKDFKI